MDNNDSMKPQQTGGLKLMTVFIAVLALHVLVIGGITVYHLMSSSSDTDLALDKTHKLKADGTPVTDATTPDAVASDKTTDSATAAPTPSPTETASTSSAPAATPAPEAVTTSATEQAAAAPTPVASNPAVTPAPVATAPKPAANPNSTGPIVISRDEMATTSMAPEALAPPPEPVAASSVPAPAVATTPKPSVAEVATTKPIVPSAAPSMTPAIASTPVPPAHDMSAATPSGPVAPAGELAASGPVHMPANGPKPSASTNIASTEEHSEHIAATKHEAKGETYTVKITDSFKKIAHAHHITVAQLKEANHIKGDVLHAGEKLTIPGGKSSLAKSEPSHESLAGMTASTASLSASPASSTTEHKHHYYTVAKGDTLKRIAKKFNVTASALEEANNLSSAKVAVGEKLRIPSREAHGTLTTAPAPAVMQPAEAIQPRQVETQPAPIAQPEPAPMAAPEQAPQPRTGASPELANMTF